jgi:hypothetical protein
MEVRFRALCRPGERRHDGQFWVESCTLCRHTGIASVCESPPDNMTIHYTSPSGLNCTRTGGVAVCTSF